MADMKDEGNFVAYMNRNKQPGDKRPAFDGRIGTPGIQSEHRMAMWSHAYTDPKTGEEKVMFSGRTSAVAHTDAPLDQIASIAKAASTGTILQGSLQIERGQFLLFPNASKDEPTKSGKPRPDYYGYYNTGTEHGVAQIGAWAGKDKYKNPMLSGITSFKPTDPDQDQAAAKEQLDDMIEQGAISKGQKGTTKGKSKGDDAGLSR